MLPGSITTWSKSISTGRRKACTRGLSVFRSLTLGVFLPEFVEVSMVRSLLSRLGLAALFFGLPTPVDATLISIVPNTVNSFRDSRGVNDLNIGGSGERNQFGADIIPATGSTITAVQG